MALELDRVREIADRVAASSGLEVLEIEFRGSGKARMLRVYLDKPFLDKPGVPGSGTPGPGMSGTGSGADSAHNDPLGGVTHGDCVNFSREFGTILDVEDAIPGESYTLEVSSPGLDRKLTKPSDFARFTGSRIKVMTKNPVNNNRFFEGRLESFNEGRLTLDTTVASKKSHKKMGASAAAEAKKLEIEFANVEKANLVPEI
jgi:ribosome maturation factor RimP